LNRSARYRGYLIEGELKGDSWLLRVRPLRPDLPILGFSTFHVAHSMWNRALDEARERIDALLAVGNITRKPHRESREGPHNF
jgi:hypothetical protein